MTKQMCLSVLVCVNLILLTAIVLCSYSPPAAYAQGTSLADDYVVVAGEIQDQHDALYIIDVRNRILHVLYYERGTKRLRYAASRDLERDFRHNRG
ncbi:MAG: hypothetical protein ACE5I3_01390 [Phycisphaerae bacterium]